MKRWGESRGLLTDFGLGLVLGMLIGAASAGLVVLMLMIATGGV